jgi:hypothetical protein
MWMMCQAGYKACWAKPAAAPGAAAAEARGSGYPSGAFLDSVRPGFGAGMLQRLHGKVK